MKTEKKTGKKTVYISRYLIAQYREHITQTLQKYIAQKWSEHPPTPPPSPLGNARILRVLGKVTPPLQTFVANCMQVAVSKTHLFICLDFLIAFSVQDVVTD